MEEKSVPVAKPENTPHSKLVPKNIQLPSRMEDEEEFVSFLNLFKSFNVNLPLLELTDKIPKYAKDLKEIMSRHKKLKKGEQINIDASCSAIIAQNIAPKLKDSKSFTIPVDIGNKHFIKAFCDLGASINLMPLSTKLKLRLGELKNMTIILQLVNRSLVHPKGMLEDVLVKVRDFIIPINFVVLDFEEDQDIPILLGWPFLATPKSTINLEKNEVIMKTDGEIEIFKCGHDSQNTEHENKIRDDCYIISFSTPNNLGQSYNSSSI
ncbi:bromodomain-containing protein [Gossypium australe]|uniref:Bromodomain-containing protein n=1 Tax=Gossypium australe TaxID=47621 RepID=A0A5B6W8Y6_9ROSI|nr:bromodomain-containing protein [Gossypium australe]